MEHARAAADKVKVDLEVLPAYMSGFAALAPDAMEIHPGVPNAYYEQGVVKGADTKPLFDKAKASVDITTYCSRQPHLHLEPDCGVAYIDDDGVLTIQSKSIGVHLHHAMICPGIGVAPEKLQADPEPVGRNLRLQVLADDGSAARRRGAWRPGSRCRWSTTSSRTSPTPASARPATSTSSWLATPTAS